MKYIFYILLIFPLYGQINIAVASNMSFVIENIKNEFYKIDKNIKIKTTIASSGKLTAQIIHGAPFDIFISANTIYTNRLYDMNLSNKPIIYAVGDIVLFTTKDIDISKGLRSLTNNRIKKIAIANPKTAPYGKATIQAIKNLGIFDDIKHKLVFAESISSAFFYGANITDMAIVAKSIIYSTKINNKLNKIRFIEIDNSLYKPIKQSLVITKTGMKKKEARLFYKFLIGKKSKEILKEFGYKTVESRKL